MACLGDGDGLRGRIVAASLRKGATRMDDWPERCDPHAVALDVALTRSLRSEVTLCEGACCGLGGR